MVAETWDERAKRHRRRVLFDGIASLYDNTRYGYPKEIVDHLVKTAALADGAAVLEVGCGTGQLTVELAPRGLALTAIDLGPAMIEATRGHLGDTGDTGDTGVSLHVCSFEDFAAPSSSFAAIVSATAFHWIDPEIAWAKSAELLRPVGWIAILTTAERYDEPLGTAFRDQWVRYSDDGGAWTTAPRPTFAETIASTGLFGDAVTRVHHERRALSADVMVELEQTRATTLSYDEATRRRFLRELRQLLDGLSEVPLVQETTLTMAQVSSS